MTTIQRDGRDDARLEVVEKRGRGVLLSPVYLVGWPCWTDRRLTAMRCRYRTKGRGERCLGLGGLEVLCWLGVASFPVADWLLALAHGSTFQQGVTIFCTVLKTSLKAG